MRHFNKQRWMAIFLVCVMALVSMAPLAEAKNRKHRRYKGGDRDYSERYRRSDWGYSDRYRRGPSRYVVRRSNTGAVIAAFLGGAFLGATLANAAPAGYAYEDPYCGRRFRSLDAYYSHCGSQRHSREVRVVAVSASYGHGGGYYGGGYDNYEPGGDYEYREVREVRRSGGRRCGDCGDTYYGDWDDHARHSDHDD